MLFAPNLSRLQLQMPLANTGTSLTLVAVEILFRFSRMRGIIIRTKSLASPTEVEVDSTCFTLCPLRFHPLLTSSSIDPPLL